jgi:hypothetical protein
VTSWNIAGALRKTAALNPHRISEPYGDGSGMKHQSIKPATTDERGQISDILYKSNFQHAAIIESKCGGLIRGNHYHKQTTQHIFITSGALRYCTSPSIRATR